MLLLFIGKFYFISFSQRVECGDLIFCHLEKLFSVYPFFNKIEKKTELDIL